MREKNYTTKSLVEASLDIGRVLADRDGVTFHAEGTCMYPAIRPGDVLRIRSCGANDVRVGDIAVCRRPRHLFCHRVVAKGVDEEGRAYIVTRQDRGRKGDDDPTFDENLLGIVAKVERRGRSVAIEQTTLSQPARLYFAFRLKLIELRLRVILTGADLLAKAQASTLSRRIGKWRFALARPQISYAVRQPVPALGDAVYRQLPAETFTVQKDWRGRPVKRWTLLIFVNGAPKPAAWLTLARENSDRWETDELFVEARYGGAGLDEMLKERADAILQKG